MGKVFSKVLQIEERCTNSVIESKVYYLLSSTFLGWPRHVTS
jgi:hypothetical protein